MEQKELKRSDPPDTGCFGEVKWISQCTPFPLPPHAHHNNALALSATLSDCHLHAQHNTDAPALSATLPECLLRAQHNEGAPALSATLSDCHRRVWIGRRTLPLAGLLTEQKQAATVAGQQLRAKRAPEKQSQHPLVPRRYTLINKLSYDQQSRQGAPLSKPGTLEKSSSTQTWSVHASHATPAAATHAEAVVTLAHTTSTHHPCRSCSATPTNTSRLKTPAMCVFCAPNLVSTFFCTAQLEPTSPLLPFPSCACMPGLTGVVCVDAVPGLMGVPQEGTPEGTRLWWCWC
eukprot:1136712-Pelagomonas_calceolata.AAC.1